MGVRSSLIQLLAAAVLAACASGPVTPVEPAQVALHFGFLKPGTTTRQEVLERLGAPRERFDRDRMLTYRVHENRLGTLAVSAFGPDRMGAREYTLVLAFNERDQLTRHTLVFTK